MENQSYYEEHKEERLAYQRKYREEHKEKLRKYRQEHREQKREDDKRYYQRNIEKRREYYEKNKERWIEYGRRYRQKHREKLRKDSRERNKKRLYRECGEFIEYKLRYLGKTQSSLARQLEITKQAVSYHVRGVNLPKKGELRNRLCEILRLKVSDLERLIEKKDFNQKNK